MEFSKSTIQGFQALYKKHFGVDIEEKQVLEKGITLINLVELIYKPIPKKNIKMNMNSKNYEVNPKKVR